MCVWLLHMHCGSLFIVETSLSVDFYDFYNVVWWLRWPFNVMTFCLFQDSFYSIALKSLISVSTVILLGLILAYHALEVQVSYRKRKWPYSAPQVHPQIMHTVTLCCVLLWFVSDYFYPYASGLLHLYQSNYAIVQCLWNNPEEYRWIGHSNVSIIDVTIKTKQSKTHSCVYYMG